MSQIISGNVQSQCMICIPVTQDGIEPISGIQITSNPQILLPVDISGNSI